MHRAPARANELNKGWFFTVLALAVFAALSAVFILPPLLEEIASDLDVSVPVAGAAGDGYCGGLGRLFALAGPLSDSVGRRPVVLAGLTVLAVSVTASAFAPNIETLLALRMLTGLAGGTMPPTAVGAVSDVISPARRAQAVGVLLGLNGLTLLITVPLVAVLAGWLGWQVPFLAIGALLAVGLVANFIWFPRDSAQRIRSWRFFSRYRMLLSLRFFRVAVAVGTTQRIAYWAIVTFFAVYLIKTYGVSVGFVAPPLAITAIAQMGGSYAAAFVAQQRRRGIIIAATSVAGGVCGLLLFTVEFNIWVAVALATVGTGLLSPAMPALVAVSTEYSGESKATGASLMGLSNQLGGALGAAIAGAPLANTGYAGIGYLCLGVTILSAPLTGLFGRQFGENAGRY